MGENIPQNKFLVTALLIAYGKRGGVNITDGRLGSTHEVQ